MAMNGTPRSISVGMEAMPSAIAMGTDATNRTNSEATRRTIQSSGAWSAA